MAKYRMTNKAIIYKITNEINGNSYIGVTSDAKKRLLTHLAGKGSVLVANAIKKYGLDAFTFERLLIGTPEYCYEMEGKLIASFGTLKPNGYNIAEGGENPPVAAKGRGTGKKYGPMSEERKRKIGDANKGRKRTDEYRAAQSERIKATMTPERREQMSYARKGRKLSEEHKSKLREIAAERKGVKRDPEIGKKVSAAKMGHTVSPETRAILSARAREQWARKKPQT